MFSAASYPAPSSTPWLLCVDLQREFVAPSRPLYAADADGVSSACRAVLASARRANWNVAHIHTRRAGALFGDASPFTLPIAGLEPRTREPLFFRSGLSIFSSSELLNVARAAPGADFHLIGFSAGGSCLATVFAGFDLGLHLTLVLDAIGAAGARLQTLAALSDLTAPLCASIGSSDLIQSMDAAAHAERH